MGNMRQTLSQIEPSEFDAAAALVADLKRKVYLVGGRITRSLADYFFTHLQVIRTGVTQIAANPSSWPHYVLDMMTEGFVGADTYGIVARTTDGGPNHGTDVMVYRIVEEAFRGLNYSGASAQSLVLIGLIMLVFCYIYL